ncbi:MAG: hypothetical protein ABIQ15_14250 [Nocardioides sp.]
MTRRRARGSRRLALLPAGLLALTVTTGCGTAPGTTDPQGVDELRIPTPSPDPADFVTGIDNPYLPLSPGSSWTYRSSGSEGDQTITVTVTDQTRVVAGVSATVVRDRVTDASGALVADTYDWYAQDVDGNVWDLGEDTTAYDADAANTDGSWEAGVDGAQAGLAMPARPRVGDGYRTEYREGVAEDQAEVLTVDGEVELGNESFDRVVTTADTTPLEPGLVERTYYAPGIGVVLAETVAGGDERVVLVAHRAG